mmetsp:Transcript_9308/g.28390  ORF Transcript_9308/g.28390 Transcript_9308/m.28390 type:complete len:142 (-) Transcript_9308:16-441(-)
MFKALHEREREKESQRQLRELAEAQYQAGMSAKEVKKLKSQLAKANQDAADARDGAAAATKAAVAAADSAGTAARERAAAAEAAARESDLEVIELRRQLLEAGEKLASLRHDVEYFRTRALSKPKRHFSYGRALSITVSGE